MAPVPTDEEGTFPLSASLPLSLERLDYACDSVGFQAATRLADTRRRRSLCTLSASAPSKSPHRRYTRSQTRRLRSPSTTACVGSLGCILPGQVLSPSPPLSPKTSAAELSCTGGELLQHLHHAAADEDCLAPCIRDNSASCLFGAPVISSSSSVPALLSSQRSGRFGSNAPPPVVGSVVPVPTWTSGPVESLQGCPLLISNADSTDGDAALPSTSIAATHHCWRRPQFCAEVTATTADDSPSASSRPAAVRRGVSPSQQHVQTVDSNPARSEADSGATEKHSSRHGRRSWQLARWGRRSRGHLEEKSATADVPIWPKGSDSKIRGRCLDRGSPSRLDEVDRLIARCMTHERPVALVQANAAILDACAERLVSEAPGSIAGGVPLPDDLRQSIPQSGEGRSDKIRRMLRLTDELRRRHAELTAS
mmetsp:Transcript_63372/g.151233  ORF Transcript_63372/g.151233 Transcript_63372/m.151233 type:complete len:424 (+) Transcript_63372:113-1384(+)